MSKTKQLSQYNGTAWETPIDIGADAANVDYPLSDDTTKPLDEVIGSVGASDSNLVTQINGKLSTNGAIDNTVLNQGPDITTYPTSGQVNDGNLVVSAGDSSRTLWSKFNAFRGRVASNFSNYIKATFVTSGTGVSSAATDAQVYSAKAIQNYFNSVIGYNSASDVSSLGSVASQLSSLNSKSILEHENIGFLVTLNKNQVYLFKVHKICIIQGSFSLNESLQAWSNIFQIPSSCKPKNSNIVLPIALALSDMYLEVLRGAPVLIQTANKLEPNKIYKVCGSWITE